MTPSFLFHVIIILRFSDPSTFLPFSCFISHFYKLHELFFGCTTMGNEIAYLDFYAYATRPQGSSYKLCDFELPYVSFSPWPLYNDYANVLVHGTSFTFIII